MAAHRRSVLLLLAVLAGAGLTEGSRSSAGPPAFLAPLIARIEQEPATLPSSSIWRYRYRGNLVYFRPARCCDMASDLYSANGKLLCHPDGGFFGGDGKCPDFLATRREPRRIWQDPRQ